MKWLTFTGVALVILTSASVFANTPTTATLTPQTLEGTKDAGSAHWQAIGGEAACVVDGGTQYANGDSTWMYNTTAVNLSSALCATLCFEYKLDNADANDFFEVYALASEPTDSSFIGGAGLLATYDSSQTTYVEECFDLGDLLGEGTVYITFYWESDTSGVADGVRLDNVILYACDEGASFTETSILYWDQDHDAYGPGESVSEDISSYAAGNCFYVSFNYYDGGWWAWWAEVDDVEVFCDGDSVLFEQFETSFPPDGWEVINDWVVPWYRNSYWGRTNYAGGDGYCADADSDASYGMMDTYLVSPVLCGCCCDDVDLEFIGAYNDIISGGYDWFEVFVGAADCDLEIDEGFDDLDDWTTVDEGDSLIQPKSLGIIKAMFE